MQPASEQALTWSALTAENFTHTDPGPGASQRESTRHDLVLVLDESDFGIILRQTSAF